MRILVVLLFLISTSNTLYTAHDGVLNTATFNALGNQGNLGGSIPGFWFIGQLGSPYSTDQSCRTLALQGQRIILGGYIKDDNFFSQYGALFRINEDGTLDTTFNVAGTGISQPGLFVLDAIYNGIALCVTIQPDSKILVAGNFNNFF